MSEEQGKVVPVARVPDESVYDYRITDRKIRRGKLTKDALSKRLSALPDLSEQVEFVDYTKLSFDDEARSYEPVIVGGVVAPEPSYEPAFIPRDPK